MSIRARLILIIVLVGTVPSLIAVFWTTAYMQDLAASSSQAALEEIGETAIRDRALATAQQLESYLRLHPEIDLSNVATLESNRELAALAVQPVGETGYTAVFDADGITHFHTNPEIVGMDMSTMADSLPEFWAIFSASLDGSPAEGYYDWQDADGEIRQKFMAVAPVGDTPLRVAATTYMDEFSQPAQVMAAELERLTNLARQRLSLSIAGVGLVALAVAIFVGIRLTKPLREMADAATRVMDGDWDAIRPLHTQDELGTLSRALSAMTHQLQELVESLEQQVAERTANLEQRTRYLEATAEVAHNATSLLDIEELLARVVTLVSQRFGFYHTGLYLLDPDGDWAILRAASSEGGRRMLAQAHRVRVGEEAPVGYVTRHGRPRIAEGGTEHPDLPETRSQMVLPLQVRGQVIGALDVHSREWAAFGDEDTTVLQALADQLAVAISNARLFQQAQESLEAERRAYGERSAAAWRELLRLQPRLGFRRHKRGLSPVGDLQRPEIEEALETEEMAWSPDDAASVAIPIKVRGHTIGVIDACKPDGTSRWTPEEITLLEALTDQLGLALESARLFQDTQRRAARERLTADISAQVRTSTQVDAILQTAIRELGRALRASDGVIRLRVGDEADSFQVDRENVDDDGADK